MPLSGPARSFEHLAESLVTQRFDGLHLGGADGGVETKEYADDDRDEEPNGMDIGTICGCINRATSGSRS